MKKIIPGLLFFFSCHFVSAQVNVEINVTNNSNVTLWPERPHGNYNFSTDESPILISTAIHKDNIIPNDKVRFITKDGGVLDDACGTLVIRTAVLNWQQQARIFVDYCNPAVGAAHYSIRSEGPLKVNYGINRTGNPQVVDIIVSGTIAQPAESLDFFLDLNITHSDNDKAYFGVIEIPFRTGFSLGNINETFIKDYFIPRYFIPDIEKKEFFRGNKGSYSGWLSYEEFIGQQRHFLKYPQPGQPAYIRRQLALTKKGSTDSSYLFSYKVPVPDELPARNFQIILNEKVVWMEPPNAKPPKPNYAWAVSLVPNNKKKYWAKFDVNDNNLKNQDFICIGFWVDGDGHKYDQFGNSLENALKDIEQILIAHNGKQVYNKAMTIKTSPAIQQQNQIQPVKTPGKQPINQKKISNIQTKKQ